MKKTAIILLASASVIAFMTACGTIPQKNTDSRITSSIETAAESTDFFNMDIPEDRTIDELKEIYPDFFELEGEPFKGVEVYVWQLEEDSYRCGLMFGTNRLKTDEEIQDLCTKSLSIDEAKMIFENTGISDEAICIRPVVMPYSSYYYEIDDEYTEKVAVAFGLKSDNVC